MANTYAKLCYHFVSGVRNRQSLIQNFFQDELYKYITGIVTNRGQKLIIINGCRDHAHILMDEVVVTVHLH